MVGGPCGPPPGEGEHEGAVTTGRPCGGPSLHASLKQKNGRQCAGHHRLRTPLHCRPSDSLPTAGIDARTLKKWPPHRDAPPPSDLALDLRSAYRSPLSCYPSTSKPTASGPACHLGACRLGSTLPLQQFDDGLPTIGITRCEPDLECGA
jgi:hypothetical protein